MSITSRAFLCGALLTALGEADRRAEAHSEDEKWLTQTMRNHKMSE